MYIIYVLPKIQLKVSESPGYIKEALFNKA
jgi:hypothetical protein